MRKIKIAELEGLIARAEQRLRELEAKAEPGTSRMMHALMNSIRKHRRELQRTRQAATKNQNPLQEQQRQLLQAKREKPTERGDLPAKQDQEPRKPAPRQGATAGQ